MDYTNYPSKQAVVNNMMNYKTAKGCMSRLSPDIEQMSTTGSFFNRRKGSYFRENIGAAQLNPDPIAVAVDINRMRERARSTLRATHTKKAEENQRFYNSLFLQRGDGMGKQFFKTPKVSKYRNTYDGFSATQKLYSTNRIFD